MQSVHKLQRIAAGSLGTDSFGTARPGISAERFTADIGIWASGRAAAAAGTCGCRGGLSLLDDAFGGVIQCGVHGLAA
ncbi:hypothetical protein STUTZSP0542_31810 [Stutzerimonas marianensis]